MKEKESPFEVPALPHVLGGLVHHFRGFWLWLGRLESNQLAPRLRQHPVRMPLYVCGLARSGSTLIHEIISTAPSVATHRVKDYPMIFTPYWWRRATVNLRPPVPRERPHRDGVMITTESPDALEEMLWMAFFPRCHDPSVSSLLGSEVSHPAFESYYDAHIRKLLLAEGATRYAAKANYHVARLPYLIRLYPDARFIIPVRAPLGHVASLRRQHAWFSEGQRLHPRALAFMQRSGHFEFGRDRRPVNLGNSERVRQVLEAWSLGDEVLGLARYWDMVYGYLARLLDSDVRVREASLVVRYEALCESPQETLRAMLEHCGLPNDDSMVKRITPLVRGRGSADVNFSGSQQTLIREVTSATASLWGY